MQRELSGTQRRSSSTVEVRFFRLDYGRVLERLRDYAERLVREGRARTVILIGSLARGDYTAFSDADVVIVVDQDQRRPLDRISEYLDPTLPLDLEPRVYTYSELLTLAERNSRLVNEIVTTGKVLAGDSRVLEELRKVLTGRSP